MKAYKYRSIEKNVFERDFETIKNNSFYSSNYNMLNDPFDIYFNEEISQVISLLKTLFPYQELDNFENQFKKVLNFKEEIGVYCLSKDFLNEQHWAYYASSYSGYCIEYDLEKLIDKSQNFDFQYKFDIDYKDNIPTLGIDDLTNLQDGFIKKMFATKKSTWKHEEEIRLIFDKYGMKKFHPSAITGIYFGIKTPEIIKESFYGLFKDLDVKFYEVFPSNFKLDFKLIHETKRKLKYDLNKFDFNIIRYRENRFEEIFDVYFKMENQNEDELKEFILAFREKYSVKESTLYIYNNEEITGLLDVYPKNDDQYIKLANSLITYLNNDELEIIYYPYKDSKYHEIINMS
ncbi:DUF2971 domain-containing protein [Chryseobacterium sp. YIM B08800]|uniref:DUF2971 domain-containing protein n=1 Tax=Chryseobacterium sp. YIM B08800 TaxID=2984136 RepID=UPI00223FAE42|nr:DUF2971 domain-containing protein [Chryseobacterium sp. YIM B08800]